MSFPHWLPLAKRAVLFGSASMFAVGLAGAQSSSFAGTPYTTSYSTSNDSRSTQIAEFAAPASFAALPSAPRPAGAAAGQEHGNRGWRQNLLSKYAIEVGGG